MKTRFDQRRRWRTAAVVTLLLAGTLAVCTGCDLLQTHAAAFSAGYLTGRWEASRVVVIQTERICYQNGVQIQCP